MSGCTTPMAAPPQAVAEPVVSPPEAPKVVAAAMSPDAGPKPCTWKAGNGKTPPCTD
jgi:hypothetical protein